MMQTLHLLGVPLVGDNDPDFNLRGASYVHRKDLPQKYQDNILKRNPKGFFDIPLRSIGKYLANSPKGEAIKILDKIFGAHLDSKDIECVIHCERRDRNAQIESCWDLMQADREYIDEEIRGGYLKPDTIPYIALTSLRDASREDMEQYYERQIPRLRDFALLQDKSLIMFYEDMLDYPRRSVTQIAGFLGLTSGLQEAMENINTYETTRL
jgi:hypothetical protein